MKFLSIDQRNFYMENGYIILDILSEEEIKELSNEYDVVFSRKKNDDLEATWKGDWNNKDEKQEVKSIHGLQMHSAVFTKLLLNTKLMDACEDIMGTENILLHHTKAHLKPPGKGSPFPMHQDYHYFPFEQDSMVAVFVSIDASEPENGGLCVYPGSHLKGPQKDVSTAQGSHYLDAHQFPIEEAVPVKLNKGQIVVFSYLLVHGSYDNVSSRPRRMHLIQLMSAEDEPLVETHKSPCQGLVLRGSNIKRNADIKARYDA